MSRYPIAVLVVLAACFAAQTGALKLSGGKTVKSESNYFSTVARIQTQVDSQPRIMMLGSSLTGRMGDRAQAFDGVANLGCDGGSAMVTLRAMDRGVLPVAPVLIVELNTLAYDLKGAGKDIGTAIDSEWFKLGRRYPNLGATARPTAFAYSWLMARKAATSTFSQEPLPVATHPAPLTGAAAPLANSAAEMLVQEALGILSRLREKGTQIDLILLPPGEAPDSTEWAVAHSLAIHSGLPFWDLSADLPPGTVAFTDGRHLDAASAQKVLMTLMRELGGER
ncbi:MAG: hypothetical protein JWO82_2452 [Akkermansiaceae bacterium]|nr:hypothetical protein [Akkermansiaceae bacterium]